MLAAINVPTSVSGAIRIDFTRKFEKNVYLLRTAKVLARYN